MEYSSKETSSTVRHSPFSVLQLGINHSPELAAVTMYVLYYVSWRRKKDIRGVFTYKLCVYAYASFKLPWTKNFRKLIGSNNIHFHSIWMYICFYTLWDSILNLKMPIECKLKKMWFSQEHVRFWLRSAYSTDTRNLQKVFKHSKYQVLFTSMKSYGTQKLLEILWWEKTVKHM
jgi:hypothetical protein